MAYDDYALVAHQINVRPGLKAPAMRPSYLYTINHAPQSMTLQMVLEDRKNGYPEKLITSAMMMRTRQEAQKAEETVTEAPNSRRKTRENQWITTICKGASDKVADICTKVGVHSVFQQKTPLRSLLKSEGTTEAHG